MIDLDIELFFKINRVWTHPLLDVLLPLFRNKVFWAPLYLFLVSFFLLNFKRKGLWIVLCILVTVGITDFSSSKLFKPLVKRERPCNNEHINASVRTLIRCGPGKSFTSSHATNHFGIAIFLAFLFGKKRRWIWTLAIFWAGIISYAQVYVGVHYPLDVICGGMLGAFIGILMAKFCRKYIDLSFV
ncbi:MAG: membrane-associated phospholipid phosphatase [Cognaticolwellia sp.]